MALRILTPEQHQQIQDRRRHTSERRSADRLLALLLLDEGQSQQQVADTLGVHRVTVGEWLGIFRTHGLEELCTLHYEGDPGELSAEQIEQLKAEIKTARFRSAKQVATWIRDTLQIDYSESGVKALLHRSGASYHKTSGFLWKADPEAQQQFVQNYEADTSQKKGRHAATQVDGCHPVWGLECVWAGWLLVGQRCLVGMGSGRKRLNILGAISPDDHEYLDIRTAKENRTGQTLIQLMEQMRAKHPETSRFILYLDNARYQHAKVVRAWVAEHPEFDLHYLPPYSPNLNLIERLWKFLRQHALTRWHETFEAMQAAVADVLDHLDRYRALTANAPDSQVPLGDGRRLTWLALYPFFHCPLCCPSAPARLSVLASPRNQ